jgi:4-aminobutyrate aminotransferase-like enzyme
MAAQSGESVKQDIARRYSERTTKTREHLEAAKKYLPGCHVYDCDGNQYVDLVNNFTSLIHGHAHPRLIEAARAQSEKGTAFAAPSVIQYEHARHLCFSGPGSLLQLGHGGHLVRDARRPSFHRKGRLHQDGRRIPRRP